MTTQMLGLPGGVEACLFDLEGVLGRTARGSTPGRWAQAFDTFLVRRSEQSGRILVPFDRDANYSEYVDGRPRLDGVHAFLGSRGIRLPEGRPGTRPTPTPPTASPTTSRRPS